MGSSEPRFYWNSLKCRNGGHTSHLLGTYFLSLQCLIKTTRVWRQVTEQDVMFRHIGTPHCVRLTPGSLMDGDSELFVCSTLYCTFVAAIHVACRTTPGFRLPPRCSEIFVLLGRYAALIGSLLLPFRDSLSCPSWRDKQSLKTGPIGCPETSVTTNQRLLKSQQNEHLQNYIYKAITLSLTLAYLGLCDT